MKEDCWTCAHSEGMGRAGIEAKERNFKTQQGEFRRGEGLICKRWKIVRPLPRPWLRLGTGAGGRGVTWLLYVVLFVAATAAIAYLMDYWR